MKIYYDMNTSFRHKKGEWCQHLAFDIYTLCCFQTPFLYECDGEILEGNAGDMLLTEPDRVIYHGPRPDAEEGTVNGYVRFGPADEVKAWLEKYPLPLNRAFSVGQDNFLRPYLEAITEESAAAEPGTGDMIHCALLEMLIGMHRAYNQTVTPDSVKRIQAVRNAVHGKPGQDWTLGLMADMSGYSVSRFSALYRERFGVSPVQDVIDARIHRSKNLLLHSGMNVSEVASVCGFCSVCHFSKLFRKSVGMSPSQYVKRMKGGAREGLPNGAAGG